jgi:hypothetical protein
MDSLKVYIFDRTLDTISLALRDCVIEWNIKKAETYSVIFWSMMKLGTLCPTLPLTRVQESQLRLSGFRKLLRGACRR